MSNSSLLAAGDDTFGPFFEPLSRQQFDFTLLFEQSILSVGPAAVLILCAAPRIVYLSGKPRNVKRTALAVIKIILLVFLLGLGVGNLTLWTRNPRTRASVAATALNLVSIVFLTVLSYIEHLHSARPSLIINAYLLLTVLLDFAEARTLWLRYSASLASIQTAASAVKVALLLAEAVEKRKILRPAFRSNAPESTTGLYSRSLFWWLNPLFLFGYKGNLSNDTLLTIDDALLTRTVYSNFKRYWQPAQVNTTKPRSSLLLAMFRANAAALAAAICPRLFLVFFRFMQPLLIRQVSLFVAAPVTALSTNEGWGLTGAFGLVYIGLALSTAIYYHQVYRTITMVRGSLVAAIFEKTTLMPVKDLNESAAVTLMSTDVQKICDALSQGHEMWASLIEIGLGVWLLWREIDFALFGPLAVTVVAVLATMSISNKMTAAMGSWMSAIQTRIDVTANILGSMKEFKMLGLSTLVSESIRNLRKQEIAKSLPSRRLIAALLVMANASTALGPGVAFIIYVRPSSDSDFDVSRAFTALSLISLVTNPVKTVIFAFGPLVEALACFRRIESYLLSRQHKDYRLQEDSSVDHRQSEGQTGTELRPLTRHNDAVELVVLEAQGVSFAWSDQELPVVRPTTFTLKRGTFTFIIGPVGCGKSTLLKGLLGELPLRYGFIRSTSSRIALVDQTTWIQRKSIRENILGHSLFDRDWYDEVVHACALHTDLRSLRQGDGTVVGSSGSSLSGGQKLRVALARAVYSRVPLLVLDDCFSGIDPGNETHIFTYLFSKSGILRRHGVAVLLVTHNLHRLSYADYVLVMSQDGVVVEEGSPNTLLEKESFLTNQNFRQKLADEPEVKESAPPTVKEIAEQQKTEEIDVSLMGRNIGDLRVYQHYFAAAGWLNIATFFIIIAGFALFSRFSELWVVFWTQAVEKHGNSVNGPYIGAYIAFGVLTLLCALGVGLQMFTRLVPRSATRLHERLLAAVMAAPLHFFTSRHTGQTLNRFSQDLSLVDSELPMSLLQVCGGLCLALIQFVFICVSAAYFTTLLPAIVGVLYFLQKYYLRTSRQIRLLDLEAKSPLFSHFLETLQGLITIRAFDWQGPFAAQNRALLDRSQKPFYLLFCVQRWLSLVLDLIVAALAMLLMVMVVKLRDELDAGLVALALLNIMSFNQNLTAIIHMWTNLETSMGAIARLKAFSENTPSEVSKSEKPPDSWPRLGEIEFKDLSAAYSLDSENVLVNLNLTIYPGEKVGICGVSGSGKSSLMGTLFYLLEITCGSLTIDGVDLTTLPRQVIRERLNAVPQHAVFLKGTIRQNMDPQHLASDAAIESALRDVGLWDMLTATNTSGRGSCLETSPSLEQVLSHGQRQLFCLARAIVRPSPIVVLDEATASVDAATDERMQHIIRKKFHGRTLIVIAHRLHTIADFDRVVVMHQGRIVEVGEPGDLLRRSGGWFKELWSS